MHAGVPPDHYKDGPLSTLKRCFDERSRVRVTVRRIDGVRGTLTGYLIAFDRHMNLVRCTVATVNGSTSWALVSLRDRNPLECGGGVVGRATRAQVLIDADESYTPRPRKRDSR